jgi:hypothetical protein
VGHAEGRPALDRRGEEPAQERRPLLGAANATPLREGDRVVGYLSVRTAPSRAPAAGDLAHTVAVGARGTDLRMGDAAAGA